MKIENVQVFGFEASIRGMRNPKDSWDKSDSKTIGWDEGECFDQKTYEYFDVDYNPIEDGYIKNIEDFVLGRLDKHLAQSLTKAGSEHCKFLRSINVWFDIDAPRYFWSEFDTYKYHVSNSCSTMHRIHSRELTQDDFEDPISKELLFELNKLIALRKENLITSDSFIHNIKNILPEGFIQRRTINTNYAELLNQYKQRKNHRLKVWREYCEWILSLPYFKEITGLED